MRTMRCALACAPLVVVAACRRDAVPDAYGNFEATEVVVSAETAGRLEALAAQEGDTLAAGAVAAVVDTAQLALERAQIVAQRGAADAQAAEAAQQIGVLEVQREIARRGYERTRRLRAEDAATAQQMDQAEREYRVLARQVDAARTQRRAAGASAAATAARLAQLGDRIARSRVTNPIGGTVLATYARAGELVQPGQPLYRIARLDTLVLRAYVAAPQLAAVRLGQRVRVSVDRGPDEPRAVHDGVVAWIADRAEFTPTPVQTRDERADLVYAVKIRVANPRGTLKIGMPADVALGPAPAPRVASGGAAR